MKLLTALALAASLAPAALAPSAVFAQAYPSKSVRLICPYAPGGSTDIISRAIANELGKTLGQQVVVDNRPGAGANVGAEMAAKSTPDGYTILMSASSLHGVTPALYTKLNYDPNKDLAPVIVLATHRYVLVVNPSMNAHSVKDIIQLAKAQPGKLTFASAGNGSTAHMSGEMFRQMADVDIVHIPYKGTGPAAVDLIGGQVNMMFGDMPGMLPHIRAGKLRPLGVTGAKREAALPDVPTIAESGVPGFGSSTWFGLAVPVGTAKEIVVRLNAAAEQGMKSPEFVKRMNDLGFDIVGGTPEQMAEMIKVEIQRWGPVVKASGARVD